MTAWELEPEYEQRAEDERARVREVLGFPDPIETTDALRASVTNAEDNVVTIDPMAMRVEQLSRRVEALGAMLETMFDRLERPAATATALTSDDMTDIAARMVQLIETRLAEHREEVATKLDTRTVALSHVTPPDHREHLAQLDDHLTLVARSVV